MGSDVGSVHLGSVARVRSGYAFRSEDMGDVGRPIVKIKNVVPPTVDLLDCDRVSDKVFAGIPDIDRYVLEEGDILIAMTGATVGKVGRVPRISERFYLNQRVGKVYLTAPNRADYRYLYYVLSQDGPAQQMLGTAQGSAQANISGSEIERLEIPLPTLSRQRTIAHILGSLDDKIELNRRMNQTLESMARSLFDASFLVGTIESVPLSGLVESIRDQIRPFDFPDRTFDHYSLPAFDDSQTPVREPGVGIMSAKWRVPEDALLISRLNPQIERVWMPDLASDAESVCSTEFLVLRAVQPYTRAFVYCLVRSEAFQEQIRSVVTGTTGSHQRAQRDAVLSLPAIAPAPRMVKWFDSMASPMMSRALLARRQRAELMSIRDAILPELLSGNLPARATDRVIGAIP